MSDPVVRDVTEEVMGSKQPKGTSPSVWQGIRRWCNSLGSGGQVKASYTISGGAEFWFGLLRNPRGQWLISTSEEVARLMRFDLTGGGKYVVEHHQGWVWITPTQDEGFANPDVAKAAFKEILGGGQ